MSRSAHDDTSRVRRSSETQTAGATGSAASRRDRRTFRARLLAVIVAATASTTLATAPAHAATANGGIYVVTPAWWGHCANFGGVAGLATVNSYVGHTNPGDYGDDIAWVPVRLKTAQSVQVRVACKRYGFAAGASMSVNITPSRHGQSFFIGPDSSYWSN